jgi:hypothetical protein
MTELLRRTLSLRVTVTPISFLGRSVAGRPGPIWSLMAWYALMAALLLVGVVSSLIAPSPLGTAELNLPLLAYCVIGVVVVGWMGARTPGWATSPL